jgi:Domain of unknown function (DUF4062)
VSATFGDLTGCRQAVNLTLRRLRCDDIGMEAYVAESIRPLDRCLADVADCDLYIGIFAWRYGSIPPDETRAFTELEYREAVRRGRPRLIFLLHEDASWPRSLMDRDASAIETLRAELGTEQMCMHFTTADELAALLAASVSKWLLDRDGSIVGPATIDPAVLAAYYARIRQHYGRVELDSLTPPERDEYLPIELRSVFTEQTVRENPPPIELPKELWHKLQVEGELDQADLPPGFDVDDLRKAREQYRGTPVRGVLDVLADPELRLVVLLGDPGSGKSTVARYLVLSLAGERTGFVAHQGHLPVLVELRAFLGSGVATFGEFVDQLSRTDGLGLGSGVLEPYLGSGGPAVVLFDGIDEIFDMRLREQTSRQIAGFAARYPSVRIVVTSRVIGYRRGVLTDAGFSHHAMQDLTDAQVGEFLTAWYGLALHGREEEAAIRRARLLDAVRTVRPIRELTGNPLLLTILAILGKHQELPRERWPLYEHAATVLVEHWDVNRHLRDLDIAADFIDQRDKKELLRRIAHRMQTGAGGLAGNHIWGAELQSVVEEYLEQRYRRSPADAKVVATAVIAQLRERNFILSRYGPELYGFVHRTFLEFFCAAEIKQRFTHDQVLTPSGLAQLYGDHWDDPSWREVLRLLASSLAERFVGEVIGHLVNAVNHPWPVDPFGDQPPWNIALAAQCLAELRDPENVPEAAELLDAIVLVVEHEAVLGNRGDSWAENELLPSMQTVGSRWPQRRRLLDWYLSRGKRIDSIYWFGLAARMAVAVAPDSAELEYSLLEPPATAVPPVSQAQGTAVADLLIAPDVDGSGLLGQVQSNLDVDARVAVVERLGVQARSAPAARSLLREISVTDPDDAVRRHAIERLMRFRPWEPVMIDFLRRRSAQNLRWALLALEAEVFDSRSAELEALLDYIGAELCRNPDESARREAVVALAAHHESPASVAAFLNRAADEQDQGVLNLLMDAANLSHTSVAAQVSAILARRLRTDPDPGKAARALVAFDPSDWVAGPTVMELARTAADHEERLLSLRTLESILPWASDAIDVLSDILARDRHPAVMRAAAHALEARSEDVPRDVLMARMTSRDRGIADESASLLMRYWPADPGVRAAVRMWIRARGGAPVLDVLVDTPVADPLDMQDQRALLFEILQRPGDEYSATTAARALLADNPDLAMPAVLAYVASVRPVVGRSALLLLRDHCRADASGVVRMRELLDDPRARAREAAQFVLIAMEPDDDELFAAACARAIDEESPLVRADWLAAVAEARPGESATLGFLLMRAVQDPNPGVRDEAVRVATIVRGVSPAMFPLPDD